MFTFINFVNADKYSYNEYKPYTHKEIAHITLIIIYKICSHESTVKLNIFINNINTKKLKRKCENIDEYIVEFMNQKSEDLHKSLGKTNKHLRIHTNHQILAQHFLLRAAEDVNIELTKNNAGFITDVFDDLYDYFQTKIINRIDYMINTLDLETLYDDMMYINSLIKKHTRDSKLSFKLNKQNTNLPTFYMKINM